MVTPMELTYQKMEKDEKAEEYLQKKLDRFGELLPEVSTVRAVITFHDKRNSYTVSLMINVPGGVIRAEEHGSDLHATIDKVADLLEQRVKRYRSRQTEWRGEKTWRHVEVPEEEYPETPDVVDYVPNVKTLNRYRSDRPISTGEAIETMELLGAPCYLFRDSKSNKWAVVYSVEENVYGITYTSDEKH